MNKNKKEKKLGQVTTPNNIVKCILDNIGYVGVSILGKHIIDNSCGKGAFLKEIVARYIYECKLDGRTNDVILKELETYIHGIELDKENFAECIVELNSLAAVYGLCNIQWDILNNSAMDVDCYNGKMDYVVGNPPYVRVHNLDEQYEKVKKYAFSKNGMTDLYIVFYELGFNMLNSSGKMGYITPNSCYNSIAASEFRKYLQESRCLYKVIDLGHYQAFKNVMTYTTIMCFDKSKTYACVEFCRFLEDGRIECVSSIEYGDVFINGRLLLTNNNREIIEILNFITPKKYTEVKNGFATLKDDFFIKDKFNFSNYIIDIIKASTGEWRKCFFPYNWNGEPKKLNDFNSRLLKKYLMDNIEVLKDRSLSNESEWYLFGRSQAIKDVCKEKIAINTTIKDIASIKMNRVKAGQGVYSGLYILSDYSFEFIESILKTEEFVRYVSSLNKCKSGGYYTYSSKDLAQYLNFKINKLEECDE